MSAQASISAPSTCEARRQSLINKKNAVSMLIEEEQKSPSSSDFYLKQLKKQKLYFKERIEGVV